MALSKMKKKKKICFGNCGNFIVENGKKKFVLAIVAMTLPKMGKKKCYEICERVKKKVVTSTIFLQHFHNKSHMISYY